MDSILLEESRQAELEKTYLAEKNTSYIRGGVIFLNTVVYVLMDKTHVVPWLALLVIVTVWPYGLYVIFAEPYRKYKVMLSSYFTYLSDAVFTTVWLYATGSVHSPFYLLWYISIIAVAFRYSMKVTFWSALLYAVSYLFLVAVTEGLPGNEADMVFRIVFIFLFAAMGVLITRETMVQAIDKILLRRKVKQAEQVEVKLQQKISFRNRQLEQSVSRFRALIESIPQMAWTADVKGSVTYVNSKWLEFTGAEDMKGWEWQKYIHPADHQLTLERWTSSIRTLQAYEIEYRWIRKDGQVRWMLGRANPVVDSAGNVIEWIGTATDIHEQKMFSETLEQRVEERTNELKTAKEQLEEKNYELMQFASIASHDLKEPLRKIITYSDLLKMRYSEGIGERGGATVEQIIKAGNRMRRLIEDLLAYSRLEGQFQYAEVDLRKTVEEIVDDLEVSIQEKQATVKVLHLPVVKGIPGQLRQVFQNLISNSIKFSRPGVPLIITIDSEKTSREGTDYWQIKVADNGIGFEEQYREKIFLLFQRLHSQQEYEGTGIGLAVCKRIMNAHKGDIMASSIPGEGSVFTLLLPAG
jgi:PAS domain S-box-containing protein